MERSAEWIYHGVWLLLTDCFRVPKHPPSMPVHSTGFCRTFHPSRRYLSYLKLFFWFGLVAIDLAILAGWILILYWNLTVAWILAVPALLIAVIPDIVAYVAIHLRYDTMWYVITDRSLRIRRGIWVIIEHTVTFENVQNIYVKQGPVQQLFGISSLIVETAGAAEGEEDNPFAVGNKAIMDGIDNPEEIRKLMMEQVEATRSTGLGDEKLTDGRSVFSSQHLVLLREIRDDLRAMP